MAGETTSINFPKTNASSLSGFSDAFVTKLNPTGSALVYSTYLGGTGTDAATGGIAVNRATGEAYVAGYTDSTDFPFTAGAFQTALGGVRRHQCLCHQVRLHRDFGLFHLPGREQQ